MVKTGVVRRIDDLGRIVIPKEIRRTLGVHEGDPFEIMLEGKSIVLEKYSSLLNLEGLYDLYLETLYEVCGGGSLAICNREYVLMAKGCSISTENPISKDCLLYTSPQIFTNRNVLIYFASHETYFPPINYFGIKSFHY